MAAELRGGHLYAARILKMWWGVDGHEKFLGGEHEGKAGVISFTGTSELGSFLVCTWRGRGSRMQLYGAAVDTLMRRWTLLGMKYRGRSATAGFTRTKRRG